jgi:serine protein kinase
VLTRLVEPKKANLSLMQKLKLYNGKSLPGFTEDNIKELREESPREGMDGISPRYIQDKVSNTLVRDENLQCINPFMVMNELEGGLDHHSLLTSEEIKKTYRELLGVVTRGVRGHRQERGPARDQRGRGVHQPPLRELHRQRQGLHPEGEGPEPLHRSARGARRAADAGDRGEDRHPRERKDDFRREIMNYIGALAIEGKTFDYKTNERLQKALELKLFEDQKDSIKLTSVVSTVVDKETQEKIDVVKAAHQDFGYCEISATDVLNYVASIFARGDVQKE